MLTLLFVICMIAVFGKLAVLALRGAWGLTKIIFSLVFLPLILIGMVIMMKSLENFYKKWVLK